MPWHLMTGCTCSPGPAGRHSSGHISRDSFPSGAPQWNRLFERFQPPGRSAEWFLLITRDPSCPATPRWASSWLVSYSQQWEPSNVRKGCQSHPSGELASVCEEVAEWGHAVEDLSNSWDLTLNASKVKKNSPFPKALMMGSDLGKSQVPQSWGPWRHPLLVCSSITNHLKTEWLKAVTHACSALWVSLLGCVQKDGSTGIV